MLDGQAGERELSGCVFSNYLWAGFKVEVRCCVCARTRMDRAAESRFDEEPRDLVGLTVFVKDHGEGEVLEFARARIGASS